MAQLFIWFSFIGYFQRCLKSEVLERLSEFKTENSSAILKIIYNSPYINRLVVFQRFFLWLLNFYVYPNTFFLILEFHIHVPGQTGHGSLLLDNTPGEKVTRLLDKIYDFRRVELQRLRNNTRITIGDVTTLNLTQIHVCV